MSDQLDKLEKSRFFSEYTISFGIPLLLMEMKYRKCLNDNIYLSFPDDLNH